jgi:hypothetical protein
MKEGAAVSIFPKVVAAMVIGAGRNRRATAAAIQSPESSGVSKKGE